MPRTSKTFRLPRITQEQLVELSEAWGVSQAEVIIICLDRQTHIDAVAGLPERTEK